MTRVICLAVVLSVLVSAGALAQDERHLFTGGLINGRYIVEKSEQEADSFIQGVIDGIGKMQPGTLSRLYPGKNRGDVVEEVKNYYRANPDQEKRTVADVILAGCK